MLGRESGSHLHSLLSRLAAARSVRILLLIASAGLTGATPARGSVEAGFAGAGPAIPPGPRELADPMRPLRLRLPVSGAPRKDEAVRVAEARRRLAALGERVARGSKRDCRGGSVARAGARAVGTGLPSTAAPSLSAPHAAAVRLFPAWIPDPELWLRVEEQLLLTAGCVCPEGSASPGGVPDGSAVPGVPLTVARNTLNPADLDLAWDPSCSSLATDYSIHEGSIGSWYSHTSLDCSTGGSTSATIAPSSGNRYFLIVPMVPTAEGSYGADSAGAERPVSATPCRAARIIAPCP